MFSINATTGVEARETARIQPGDAHREPTPRQLLVVGRRLKPVSCAERLLVQVSPSLQLPHVSQLKPRVCIRLIYSAWVEDADHEAAPAARRDRLHCVRERRRIDV
eukprot:377976-Prymnesium_polylepis.3